MEYKLLKLQTPHYLASTDAAQRFGLTNDHIASLCRRGKVAGKLKGGRVWYVSEESLQNYLVQSAEEKLARHKALSASIRREQESAQPEHYFELNVRHAAALALPLFLALALTVPVLPATGSALTAAAAGYTGALEVAVELQVDAYQTLSSAVAFVASGSPAREVVATPVDLQLPAVGGEFYDALARVPDRVAAATAGHTLEIFGSEELFLVTEDLVPISAVVAEIPNTTARFYSTAASSFIAGVYAAGDLQERAYLGAIGALYALSDDLSAAAVLAVQDISYSATMAALWYIDSSATVYARTQLR